MTKAKPEGRSGAKYPDSLIAKALAFYDFEGTIDAVVKKFGVTHSTVKKWIRDRDKIAGGAVAVKAETFGEIYSAQKDILLKANIELQGLALKQVKAKLGSASAYQAALIYGILHDKVVRATGENPTGSTTNILISNMGQEEATELMTRVLERANSSSKKGD